jgi:uncharacterized protein YukE
MTGFTAQTTNLGDTAPQYDSVAQQVQSVYTTLVNALETEGACWGNDTQGQSFGAKYCPPALSLLQQMGNTNQGLQSMVDGICAWAKNYVNVDQLVAQQAAHIGNSAG